MIMMMREARSFESFACPMYNVVQRILKHATFCGFERPLNRKADPILLGSAAFDLLFALPQELVRAIGSGFKSPLPHQHKHDDSNDLSEWRRLRIGHMG
jgi:hypothetical protein